MTVDAMKKAFEDLRARGLRGMTIYYTLRELSNIAPELFALQRSSVTPGGRLCERCTIRPPDRRVAVSIWSTDPSSF